jgi:hypothetical protein
VRYDVFVTVWGKEFVSKFAQLSLASQLAAGNLPALALEAEVHYHIYTDRSSRNYFERYIPSLAKYAEIHFYFYDEILYRGTNLEQVIQDSDIGTAKHNVQRITAQHMLARLKHSAAILLDSDFIIADGSFIRMHKLRLEGKRAIMVSLMRLNETASGPILKQNLPAYLAPRKLVKLCLDHMHPFFESYYVDAIGSTAYPSQLNWRVNHSFNDRDQVAGIITHGLFPHPLMIEPDIIAVNRGVKYFSTMDYDCVFRAIPDDEAIHLSRSSDEILVCKISPQNYLIDNQKVERLSIDRMAHFILNNTNIRHRLFLGQTIRHIASDDGNWDVVSRGAADFIEVSYKAVELMIGRLSAGDPLTTVHLKSFLGPIDDFISPQVRERIKKWLPK